MGALTTLRSVFKAEAEATKKKKTRGNLVPPPIFVKTRRKFLVRRRRERRRGPLGRRDQLRLTCVSAGAPLWLDGATTDALSRLIFLKIDF